jgi:hypothetical protein
MDASVPVGSCDDVIKLVSRHQQPADPSAEALHDRSPSGTALKILFKRLEHHFSDRNHLCVLDSPRRSSLPHGTFSASIYPAAMNHARPGSPGFEVSHSAASPS